MNAVCTTAPGTTVSPYRRSGAVQAFDTTVFRYLSSCAARVVESTHMLLIIPTITSSVTSNSSCL